MTKKEIIQMVADMKKDIGEDNLSKLFVEKEKKNNNGIGTGQFIEIATLCSKAECYEEIELLIQYNIAKSYAETGNKSWNFNCYNNDIFGNIVINCMQNIHKRNNNNDINTLKDLSLYFGYLFWQSKVWSTQN